MRNRWTWACGVGAALLAFVLVIPWVVKASPPSQATGWASVGETNVASEPSLPGVLQNSPQVVNGLPAWGNETLADIAVSQALGNGGNRPSSVRYVLTGRQRAEWYVERTAVDSNQSVYLVIMTGSFTDRNAYVPAGAPLPTGTTMAITINASTGAVLDMTLNDLPYRNLSTLGHVTVVHLGASQ